MSVFNDRDLDDIQRIGEQQLVAPPHPNRCWLIPAHWPCRERFLLQDLREARRVIPALQAAQQQELAGKDALIDRLSVRNETLRFRLERWRAAIIKSAADARDAADALQEL